jgi:protein-L-isoaspartate(D-aspartate) O-methyltransferase
VRRAYADEVAAAANVTYALIVEAFAAVPRERFLFAGPWQLPLPVTNSLEETPNDDPRHIYVDRLVTLDAVKNLNNGVPSFWAGLFEHLKPMPGERVIHAGAGTGYYSAILAHMVGSAGSVLAIEYEPHLAAHAARAFADQPNVEVVQGDALTRAHGEADMIVASAGLDAVPLPWVGLLKDGGRLLVPLTAPAPRFGDRIGGGAMLLVTRRGPFYDARFVSGTLIYHFMGTRSAAASQRLAAAFGGTSSAPAIASLRLDDQPDESAWLVGDGWWLSKAAV